MDLALVEIQDKTDVSGVLWNEQLYFTKEYVANYFQVDIRTISRYIEQDNGVRLITTANSRVITNQYSKYLDTDALVWDSYKERLLIYISDPENPKMAFKGSSWLFAKRLRPEFADLSLEDIYLEAIKSNN